MLPNHSSMLLFSIIINKAYRKRGVCVFFYWATQAGHHQRKHDLLKLRWSIQIANRHEANLCVCSPSHPLQTGWCHRRAPRTGDSPRSPGSDADCWWRCHCCSWCPGDKTVRKKRERARELIVRTGKHQTNKQINKHTCIKIKILHCDFVTFSTLIIVFLK